MAKPRHLNHAPIVEALLHVKGRYDDVLDRSFPKQVRTVLGPDFPTAEERIRWQQTVTVKDGAVLSDGPTKTSDGPDGYRFRSAAGNKVVVLSLDGFTYSQLQPYPGWEPFIGEARRLRSLVNGFATPGPCTGVELRFINLLELPLPVENLKDYLAIMPSVPGALTGAVNAFLTRVDFEDPGTSARVSFTEALQPSTNPRSAALIMDIGLSLDFVEPPDEATLCNALAALRRTKNEVFFKSVKDKLLKRYQ